VIAAPPRIFSALFVWRTQIRGGAALTLFSEPSSLTPLCPGVDKWISRSLEALARAA